jgi:hypothetical protein
MRKPLRINAGAQIHAVTSTPRQNATRSLISRAASFGAG